MSVHILDELRNHDVVGWIICPQDVQILILRTCEYIIILYIKEDFADVIKFRVFRWEGYPGMFRWANVFQGSL